MKKVFILAVATLLFAYQSSFASKKSEFTFGLDKILTYRLINSVDYVDGKKVATKIENGKVVPIKEYREEKNPVTGDDFIRKVDKIVDNWVSASITRDYGREGVAPKVEYCCYVWEQLDKTKAGIGLGINKFFNSDFDPFNVYAIGKIVLPPINNKCNLSFGTNIGYGIFSDKYETIKGTFKADKVYSVKVFVKFDYKNFFIDLSAMTNIIPIDAKIKTKNEGVKHLEKSITYDVIMLGIGHKFAI